MRARGNPFQKLDDRIRVRRFALLSIVLVVSVAGVRPSGTIATIELDADPGYAVFDADGTFAALNPAHGLRVRFDGEGAAVQPLDGHSGAWSLGVALRAIGRGEPARPVEPIAVTMAGNQVAYSFPNRLSATFENAERGLAIVLSVPDSLARFGNSEALRIELALTGSLRTDVAPDGTSAEATLEKRVLLRLDQLRAFDAAGRELAIRLEPGRSLALVVNDADAAYPISAEVVLGSSGLARTDDPAGPIRPALVPPNDTCAGAEILDLDTPVFGNTAAATDDYHSTGNASCYSGIGQATSTAAFIGLGRDAVYSFTAPDAGAYSFRAAAYGGFDLMLYLTGTCPVTPPAATVSCIAGANRTTVRDEEILCRSLTVGEEVHVIVDDRAFQGGGPFRLEVTRCRRESEPNDATGLATTAVCGIEGSFSVGSPLSDVDFFSLGAWSAGSRVFALVDAVAANNFDADMRITSATDTLEYDDADADTPFGPTSATCAGTILPGGPAFMRLNSKSTTIFEPYRLYATVQPPASLATPESEPNDSIGQADAAVADYFSGTLASAADVDFFAFQATAGEVLFLGLDGDPLRNNTPINAALALLDSTGAVVLSVNDSDALSSTTPGTGSLAGFTPTSPGEGLAWRATYTGTYYARVGGGAAGDWLLSITRDCVAASPTDLELTKSAQATVGTGQNLVYDIRVRNAAGSDASTVELHDAIPAATTFRSITAPADWTCSTPAVGGTGDVSCTTATLPAGVEAVFSLVVRTDWCAGDGTIVLNEAEVTSVTAEADPGDNSASASTTILDFGFCDDDNACTHLDVCQAGVCVGTNPEVCTASNSCHLVGTCDPQTGACSNPTVANGTSCTDGDGCTQTDTCQNGNCTGTNPVVCTASNQCHTAGTCDPGTGLCSDPEQPNGTACNDADACTQTDTCQGGACQGASPVVCTALDQCHVPGVCAPATGVCSNPMKADGQACTDGNACTQTDTCQTGTCQGANPVVCSASDPCHAVGTCDSATGVCSNPTQPNGTTCNDGNACTQTDTCQAGGCQGTNPVVCTALDQCHSVGTCAPATGVCSNPARSDGDSCNDGTLCTQTDTCQAGACQGTNPVVCTVLDQCHVLGACAAGTGVCSNPLKPDGQACSDTDACTQTDTCQSGVCQGANPVVCTALDQCHLAGTCDPGTGDCPDPAKPDGQPCSDGDACTQSDTCQGGACQGTNPVVCAALNSCHEVGVCAPATGECSNPTLPDGTTCDDGSLCTRTDTCQTGTCSGADPVSCATVCTPDVDCPSFYRFSHAPGTGSHDYFDEPHNSAANGAANDNTGFDQFFPGQLTDGARGADFWDADLGSGHGYEWVGWAFDDPTVTIQFPSARSFDSITIGLDQNTTDLIFEPEEIQLAFSLDGTTFGSPFVFRQSDATLPSFPDFTRKDLALGFPTQLGRYVQITFVNSGKWTFVDEVAFGAPDQCHTAGTCDPETGSCSNPSKPDGTSCDDGDLCTHSDACQAGTCQASPVVCAAQDDCHQPGACDAGTGVCSNPEKPDGEPCSDGDACTQTDTCDAGVCQGANPVVCAVPDTCHLSGVCAPGTGVCSNPEKPNGTACEDGAFCSVGETCTDGVCAGSSPRVCTDPTPCNVGTCDEDLDDCTFALVNAGDPDGDGVPACIDTCPDGINGGPAPDCVAPPGGIVAWWPLDETDGSGPEDLAGDHDGTQQDGPTAIAGMVDGGLSFDGQNDYVEVPDDPGLDFGTDDFSVDAWIRIPASPPPTDATLIVDKRREQSAGGPQGWALFTSEGRLWFQLSTNGLASNYDSGIAVNDGQWHHVAVTVDRDDPAGGKFYVDYFAPLPAVVTFNPTPRNASLDNDAPLRLGRRSDSDSPGFYAGDMDEVELFRGALSAAAVEALATAGAAGKCKPDQGDSDGDGLGDACDPDDDGDGVADTADCAPLDPDTQSVPEEITLVRISTLGPGSDEVEWSAGNGAATIVYDLVAGPLSALPVGSGGGASESGACGETGTTATIALDPPLGTGSWIIVRARNQCGAGSYGADRDNAAPPFPLRTPRTTATCP